MTGIPPDPDTLVDRRRLKRQVSFWRVAAIVLAVAAIGAAGGRFGAGLGWRDYVAVLPVSGIITDDPARTEALEKLSRDSRAKALIVRIDSPGGTVVGGEALYRALREVAARKPVVAVLGELAASGGYMTAIAADRLIAREGTLTGSIGVILQTTDVTGLLDKIGVTAEAIKSAPLKAVPSPLEKLTDEGRAATRLLVADMYDMFVGMVAERRNLPRERALQLADGRVYTGRQALANGLIDQIGAEREAREWLAGRGVARDLPEQPVQIEHDEEFWRGAVGGAISALTGKTYLSERLTLDGLLALWHPN